jgi:hypothetical protein
MSMNLHPERIERIQTRTNPDALDDRVVLRLSRASLKADPPVVEFVDRVNGAGGLQRLLWPA